MLVDVKMKNKFLVSLNNLEEIEIYKKEGINSFLLPLKDYTVGYPNTYSVSKINSINETKYCLINKVLDNKEIDNLEDILPTIDVKGFVIEDDELASPTPVEVTVDSLDGSDEQIIDEWFLSGLRLSSTFDNFIVRDKDELIEPVWLTKKFGVLNDIDKEMKKRDTYQGKYT